MGEACLKFDTPVTGGNVSFYNQHPDGAVYPTPTIGMVGLLEDTKEKMTLFFKQAGDQIFMIGKSRNDINSSAYSACIARSGISVRLLISIWKKNLHLQTKLLACIQQGLIESAHDVAEGGLFIPLLKVVFIRIWVSPLPARMNPSGGMHTGLENHRAG